MSVENLQGLHSFRPSFSKSVTNDPDIDEDSERILAALLDQCSTEDDYKLVTSNLRNNYELVTSHLRNNYELMTSHLPRPIKHVAIQTTPEVDERDYSWLLNMESKADALCVDVSNMLNTLMQAESWDSERQKFEQNSLSLDFILNRKTGDKKKGSVKSEFILPRISTCNGSSNLSFPLMLQNIKNKMKIVLKSATELRNSIPIVSTDNVKETSDKSVQAVASELKNIPMVKNHPENWIHTKVPKQNRTKTTTISTEKAVTFKLQRSTTQIPLVNCKNASMLKKQISSLNSKWKGNDFTTAKTSSNFSAKEIPATANDVKEKDMKATGAIPKKTNLHMNDPIIHKRIDRKVTETSKTKQVTSQKPIWR